MVGRTRRWTFITPRQLQARQWDRVLGAPTSGFRRPSTERVDSHSKHALQIDGICSLSVRLPRGNVAHPVKFYVIRTSSSPILGLTACSKLKLISRRAIDSATLSGHDSPSSRSGMVADFADDCDSETLGRLDAVQIISIPSPPPPKKFPSRRIPIRFKDAVERQLSDMVRSGVLERSARASRYVLSVVTVMKSDESFRL